MQPDKIHYRGKSSSVAIKSIIQANRREAAPSDINYFEIIDQLTAVNPSITDAVNVITDSSVSKLLICDADGARKASYDRIGNDRMNPRVQHRESPQAPPLNESILANVFVSTPNRSAVIVQ